MSPMPNGGLVAIAVTPLDERGRVDAASMQTLMDFYVACGASGVAILGVMGEANRMTDVESRQVVDLALESLGARLPLIVGVSNPSLSRVSDLGRYAIDRGADGVMLQPAPGLQGDEAVADYFAAAALALGPDISVCVQDYPKASGVHISVEAWKSIVKSCPTVTMLKAEDEPGLRKISAIRAAEASGLRRVTILTGNNGIQLPQELGRGVNGAMTGFAFPDVLARVIVLHTTRDVTEAEDLFDQYLAINRYELRMGLAVRKELLFRRGAIATPTCRYPLSTLDSITSAELDRLIDRVERATEPITEIRFAR